MKKKLLVLGDSFMRPDDELPGQHWSEMLPEYEILMYAISGSSNGIIAYQFYQGLEQNPDAVVLGFTEPNRLEFEHNSDWITGAHQVQASSEQKLLADMFKIHASQEMLTLKDCSIVRGLLSTLETKRIPYAWSLNLLFNSMTYTPFPSDPWVNKILGGFFYRMTPTNLASYPGVRSVPSFHVNSPEWQNRYAQEVRTLCETIDFLPTAS